MANIYDDNIHANGEIERVACTLPNPAATDYHFINFSFLVD